MDCVGMDGNLDMVGLASCKAGDDAGAVDFCFGKQGGKILGVSPAVLEQDDNDRSGPRSPLNRPSLRCCRGGVITFRTDQDEIIVDSSARSLRSGYGRKLPRPGGKRAENPRADQAVLAEHFDSSRPGKQSDTCALPSAGRSQSPIRQLRSHK